MNKITNIKERIRYIADIKKIKKEEFFNQLGISSANFRGDKIDRPINSDTIENLITLYPDINPHWLLTGEGEPFHAEVEQVNEPNTTYTTNTKAIPLIHPETLRKLGDQPLQFAKNDIIEQYVVPKFNSKGVEYLLEYDGPQHMFSNIKSGNLLGCKRISDTSFIQWGKPYVLITQQGVMVRKLFPVNEKETTVECRTEDEDNHPPFQINLDSIFSISIILGILHAE